MADINPTLSGIILNVNITAILIKRDDITLNSFFKKGKPTCILNITESLKV